MARFQALLIGNWEYQDPDGLYPPLKGPEFDLKAMEDALTHEKFGLCRPGEGEVTVLRNLESSEIAGKLDEFIQAAEPDDVLLIYYSGHGARLVDSDLGLCGVDVRGSRIDSTAFNAGLLRKWLDNVARSRSKIVVLDCCYAGGWRGEEDPSHLAEQFGTGTCVLASSGNTTAPDALEEGKPSKFTGRLAAAMRDESVEGDQAGFADAEAVFRRVLDPPLLQPRPLRNVVAQGVFPLARREAAAPVDAGALLEGFDRIESVEEVGVAFGPDRVRVTWPSTGPAGRPAEWPLEGFDAHRQAAVRRMAQLADATIRAAPDRGEHPNRRAAEKAWECLGVNLFETAFPEELRETLKNRDHSGGRVTKLVLSFDEEAALLEQYPWEFLQSFDPSANPGEPRQPLGQQTGLLVERCARRATHRPPRPPGDGTPPATAAVINSLRSQYAKVGNLLVEHLEKPDGVKLASQERDASWQSFMKRVDTRPHPDYLLLFVPVRRSERKVDLWFTDQDDSQGWVSASTVANRLKESRGAEDPFRAIVLATVSAAPGEDCARGVIEAARVIAGADVGPVVFVCHSPSYAVNAKEPTFSALLVDALQQGKDLDRSVYWARDSVWRVTPESLVSTMGVPGYYAAPSPEQKPQTSKTGGGVARRSRQPAARPKPKERQPSAGE